MLRAATNKGILNFRKQKNAERDLSRHQVFLVLQRAMQARELLEVRIKGDDTVYQSLILEVDSDEGTVLIDELFPGTYQAAEGQWLSVGIRQKGGRRVRFDAPVLQQFSYDGAPIYVIAMPEDLDQDQRRTAFRLPIESNIVVDTHFVGPDQCHYTGVLRNLSSGGLSLATNRDDELVLRYGDMLRDLVFDFDEVRVECDASVRSVIADKAARNPIHVGVQFVQMSTAEQQRLEKMILKIQRESLRNNGWQRDTLID